MNDQHGGNMQVLRLNDMQTLADVFVERVTSTPLPPLDDEIVIVQNAGMGDWLRHSVAVSEHSRVCASLETILPARFVWRMVRAVLGDRVPEMAPLGRDELVWRFLDALRPDMGADTTPDPVRAPLQRFLATRRDDARRLELAQQLADVFDQYQVYRPQWLLDWEAGHDVLRDPGVACPRSIPVGQRWQPDIWRQIVDAAGSNREHQSSATRHGADGQARAVPHRARVHQQFIEHAARIDLAACPGIPSRVTVFGVSSLPPTVVETLQAIARHAEVAIYLLEPSESFWQDVTRQALAEEPELGHSLLASWGAAGRDFRRLLAGFEVGGLPIDDAGSSARSPALIDVPLFDALPERDPQRSGMLQRLQDDLRFGRSVAQACAARELDREPHGGAGRDADDRSAAPKQTALDDDTCRFHACFGPTREIEILHDRILAWLEEDATLDPRDIVVMAPEIDRYVPMIEAVFGAVGHDDPRRVPYSISDRARASDPVLRGAIDRLIDAASDRFVLGDWREFFLTPAFAERLDANPATLATLFDLWLAAGARWGLNTPQRRATGAPGTFTANTWQQALERLLLGVAMGVDPASTTRDDWQSIEPAALRGRDLEQGLGALAMWVDALQEWTAAASVARSLGDWSERLRRLLRASFRPTGIGDERLLQRVDDALDALEDHAEAAAFDAPIAFDVVRILLRRVLDAGSERIPFLAGGVQFCSLRPMRAVPFRRVCLIGQDSERFPRPDTRVDFNLMEDVHRAGDRSRREDDRYLFLEALLSARERIHISWTGFNPQDAGERFPSVLVAQLREYLDRVEPETGPDASRIVASARQTQLHPLQPFDRRNFAQAGDPRFFSYAAEWRNVGAARSPDWSRIERWTPATASDEHPGAGAEPVFDPGCAASIGELARLLKSPLEWAWQTRFRARGLDEIRVAPSTERFAFDPLDTYQWIDSAIEHALQIEAAATEDVERSRARGEAAINAWFARRERSGDGAWGFRGEYRNRELRATALGLYQRFHQHRDPPNEAPRSAFWCWPMPQTGHDRAAPWIGVLDTLPALRETGEESPHAGPAISTLLLSSQGVVKVEHKTRQLQIADAGKLRKPLLMHLLANGWGMSAANPVASAACRPATDVHADGPGSATQHHGVRSVVVSRDAPTIAWEPLSPSEIDALAQALMRLAASAWSLQMPWTIDTANTVFDALSNSNWTEADLRDWAKADSPDTQDLPDDLNKALNKATEALHQHLEKGRCGHPGLVSRLPNDPRGWQRWMLRRDVVVGMIDGFFPLLRVLHSARPEPTPDTPSRAGDVATTGKPIEQANA